MNNSFLKSNILVLLIANSANVFAYLFQFVLSRYLTVEDYGILNAVNSLGVTVGALMGIIPYITAKYVIEFKGNRNRSSLFIYNLSRFTLVVFLVLFACILLFTKQITSYLNISDPFPIYILILGMFTGIFLGILLGSLQGLLMYVRASVKGASGAFFKFVFACILVVWCGYSYNGALAAGVLANIVIIVWAFVIINRHIPFEKPKNTSLPSGTYKRMLQYALPVGLMGFAIGVITNIDIVLVKHYASPVEAGEYSVAAILARIAIFLPGVLLAVLFPQVTQDGKDGKSAVGSVVTVMLLTLLLAGIFTVVILLFPKFIISVLFGAKYVGASDVLMIIAPAMALVSVVSVIFNFFVAKHIYSFLYITYFVIIGTGIVILGYTHGSSMEIAKTILYGIATLTAGNILLLFFYYFRNKTKEDSCNAVF